jgi:hypothetical protein
MGTANTNIRHSPTAGDLISDSRLQAAVQPCQIPVPKCRVAVYVYIDTDSRPPLIGAGTAVAKTGTVPGAGKPTNDKGLAEYPGLDPTTYTAKVTLTPQQMIDYAWPDTDVASTEQTQGVPALALGIFRFPAIPLARPCIQVLWQEDKSAVSGVKVTLKTDVAYSDTNGAGLSQLPGGVRGLRAGEYPVKFVFDTENIELMDGRPIGVPQGGTETEVFHIRKCWVEFTVSDQFSDPFSAGADFVLTYPGGSKTETGTLPTTGKVRRDCPPGEYKFALKLLYQAKWGGAPAKVGEEIALTVEATGYAAGEISFEIFDGCSPTGAALDTVTASSLTDNTAQAKWTPDEQKLSSVTSGTVVFAAKAGKSVAYSPPIPILGKRTFNVTGPSDALLSTDLVLTFSDGDRLDVTSAEGKAEPMVPLGKRLVSIGLPALSKSTASFTVPGATGTLGCYLLI